MGQGNLKYGKYLTLIYWERVITAFGRRINENMSPNGKAKMPTPPNI